MSRGKALSRVNPAFRSRIRYHKFDVDKLTIEELQRILWDITIDTMGHIVGHNDWAADTLPLVANVLDYDFR